MPENLRKIVLASKSADRRDLFKHAGIPFEKLLTKVDEKEFKKKISDPILLVKELAKQKALYAKNELSRKESVAIIIAADTIVEMNGEIIGKAENENEAFEILKKLMGKSHNLITGIAITEINNPKIIIDYEITAVELLKLSDEELYGYIKTKEWVGRAGAYSINDKASLFINKINGSTSNVIGFPMHKLFEILKNEFDLNLFQIEEV
ncbi:MAG: Maf family protein [Promethearchaeota archaeon]|jgi:septum formation protein